MLECWRYDDRPAVDVARAQLGAQVCRGLAMGRGVEVALQIAGGDRRGVLGLVTGVVPLVQVVARRAPRPSRAVRT